MKIKRINVARDYSIEPAGRFPSDGPVNGQRFRQDFLRPALRNGEKLIVDFDGTEGYGSSFLEEAFGGLVRLEGFDRADMMKRITIESTEDPSVIDEIRQYIEQASPEV